VTPIPGAAPPSDLSRRALQVLFWSVALSLGFNALFGDMGLIQGARQRRLAARLEQEVATVRAANETALAEIRALRLDPYRIETIAREELGLSRPGEIIFLFNGPGNARQDAPAATPR
jgi:cell division protein FtsB